MSHQRTRKPGPWSAKLSKRSRKHPGVVSKINMLITTLLSFLEHRPLTVKVVLFFSIKFGCFWKLVNRDPTQDGFQH